MADLQTIDCAELRKTIDRCLFTEVELNGLKPGHVPAGTAFVDTITIKFGFHGGRLEDARDQVLAWLKLLPHGARISAGGGMSFLNLCVLETGQQWGEHSNVQELMALGLGLGLVKELLPHEMWHILPGGMPYYVLLIKD